MATTKLALQSAGRPRIPAPDKLNAHMPTPLEALRTNFGYEAFRATQEDVIDSVLAGVDTFALMPTGGGKSLCYQIPAIVMPGTAIVVSPLISLMKDQVDALREVGVAAAAYNSALSAAKANQVVADFAAGKLKLLYVAPERLMGAETLEMIQRTPLSMIAIDEAHCVSQWGHDFRPEYVKLGRLRTMLPSVPFLALTATADPQTRVDIVERLGLREPQWFVAGFDRPNIRYTVRDKAKPMKQLQDFLKERPEDGGIVYCLSRNRVEQVAADLSDHGISAEPYHAGMSTDERTRVQELFQNDSVRVVAATVAFGMGIDKPNVRFVVHYDLPKNVEGYYQETGRAGRDGLPSDALLLFGAGDMIQARLLIESGPNPERNRIELQKLRIMQEYCESQTCRRQFLLRYFGEQAPDGCGNCDLCLSPPETEDATAAVKLALMGVYETGQRYGMQMVVDVLRGGKSQRIVDHNLDQVPSYAKGKDRSADDWTSTIRQLLSLGFLRLDGEYGVLKLTPATKGVLRDGERVILAKPRIKPISKKESRSRASDGVRNKALFEALRALRLRLAKDQGVAPYVVFGDVSLIQMADYRPRNRDDMLRIAGVGEHKLARYGDQFLAEIGRFGT